MLYILTVLRRLKVRLSENNFRLGLKRLHFSQNLIKIVRTVFDKRGTLICRFGSSFIFWVFDKMKLISQDMTELCSQCKFAQKRFTPFDCRLIHKRQIGIIRKTHFLWSRDFKMNISTKNSTFLTNPITFFVSVKTVKIKWLRICNLPVGKSSTSVTYKVKLYRLCRKYEPNTPPVQLSPVPEVVNKGNIFQIECIFYC